MKYFYYSFGLVHLLVSVIALFHSAYDPFSIALSIVLFTGGAGFLFAADALYKLELKERYPEHAVPENVPPEEDLNEPTYMRRSYIAYRDAWERGDQRCDEVSCNRLVSYHEYKDWFTNQPLPF